MLMSYYYAKIVKRNGRPKKKCFYFILQKIKNPSPKLYLSDFQRFTVKDFIFRKFISLS